MGAHKSDGTRYGGDHAELPETWVVEHHTLWAWIGEALCDARVTSVDRGMLRALCAQALDTHAPAVLVHAQAAGIALEHLLVARLLNGYLDAYGHAGLQYDVARLRAISHRLGARGTGAHL